MNSERIPSPIQSYLEYLHEKFLPLRDGAVADYIPELAKSDPDWFGIAMVTVDGHVYQVGETHQSFTIQSISKPIVYGLAMEDNGLDLVRSKVGVEPTGDTFNSISLDPVTGCPLNPMINAGAVATTGLVAGADAAERMGRILKCFSRYVGHPVSVDEVVYASERDTGHRNRAISHMLRNFDVLEGNPEDALDLYFRQCSITVTARDLAVMAACLANSGINPITSEVALESRHVEKVLSIMSTCGMYDYAGGWIYDVGMPAKSGVAGGIVAVLPGQVGIGIFSPPLDAKGNSVRGIATCRELSRTFNLHLFHPSRRTVNVIRARYDGASVHSKRIRSVSTYDALQEHGGQIRVYELHGDMIFLTTELVLNELLADAGDLGYVILDFKRVLSVDSAACRMIADLVRSFLKYGKVVLLTCTSHLYAFTRALHQSLRDAQTPMLLEFRDIDSAMEWCEDQLLDTVPMNETPGAAADVRSQEMFAELEADELLYLCGVMIERRFALGELIIKHGDLAESIYFLTEGEASVLLPVDGGYHRIAAVSAGMYVGEMAMLDPRPRSADVRAETPIVCYELPSSAIAASNPNVVAIRAKLLRNLGKGMARKLRYANMEIRSLS